MSLFQAPPLHDFPDRAFRELLSDPSNLRDLIAALLPDIAARLDFSRREILPRTFLLDDWRRRESDLLVRLPWLPGAGEDPPLLVCLLIEHQSQPDSPMPLRTLLYAVLRRLEGLSEQDRVRWEGLLWFVLSWGLRRRRREEHEALLEATRESQAEVRHQEEVRKMSETIVQTWEQELLTRGQAEGEARGRAVGHVEEAREMLRAALEEKFGAVPEALVRRIASTHEVERLRAAHRRVFHISAPSELEL